MLDPVVQSALVVLVGWLLTLVFQYFNIPVSSEIVMSIAAAIVAWLIGVPAGARVAEGFRASVRYMRGVRG